MSRPSKKGVEYPGSQAGIADMISAAQDEHRWDSSAFWHWNLRMQVAANIGAGLPELNATYFNLYRENLASIEQWTRENMKGLPGVCVPETMRFNGPGIEYESAWKPAAIGRNCDANFKPYYNARTITTGAEVSLWVWQQYLVTGDRNFLAENYPLMASVSPLSARLPEDGAGRPAAYQPFERTRDAVGCYRSNHGYLGHPGALSSHHPGRKSAWQGC